MNDSIKTDEFLEFLRDNKDTVWIFLDTETLGFNPVKHQMTEVAAKAVRFNGSIFEEIDTYHEKAKLLSITRLRMSMPFRGKGMSYQDIMKMTNYGEPIKDREYIEEKQMLEGIFKFLNKFDEPTIVAHNSSFDIKYLNTRHNSYFSNKDPYNNYDVLDTLKVMKKYFTSMVATESKRYKHRWLPETDKQSILEMRRIRKALQKKNKKRMSLKLGNVAESLGVSAEGWHSAKFDVETLISTTERMLELFKDNAGKELRPEKYFL
jgi:DNA polymerase III alpha subunit (gram-positive type)